MDEQIFHEDDFAQSETDVLLKLPHHEIENYIREARCTIDNAQMIYDRLRAIRMEKIRLDCICASRRNEVCHGR